MKEITKEKWDKTCDDYKLIDEKGQKKILENTINGTTLTPVKIKKQKE